MDMFSKLINELNGKLPNVPDDQPVPEKKMDRRNVIDQIINDIIDQAEGSEYTMEDVAATVAQYDQIILDAVEAGLKDKGYLENTLESTKEASEPEGTEGEKRTDLPKEGDKEVEVSTRTIRNFELTMVSRDSDSQYALYLDKKLALHGKYGGAGAFGEPTVDDGEAVADALILLFDENE